MLVVLCRHFFSHYCATLLARTRMLLMYHAVRVYLRIIHRMNSTELWTLPSNSGWVNHTRYTIRTKDDTMITQLLIATLPNLNITGSPCHRRHRTDRSEIFRNLLVIGRCSPATHRTIIGKFICHDDRYSSGVRSANKDILPCSFAHQFQVLLLLQHVHRKRGQSH